MCLFTLILLLFFLSFLSKSYNLPPLKMRISFLILSLQLSVKGYNDKLTILLKKILEKMATFVVDPTRLAIFKEMVIFFRIFFYLNGSVFHNRKIGSGDKDLNIFSGKKCAYLSLSLSLSLSLPLPPSLTHTPPPSPSLSSFPIRFSSLFQPLSFLFPPVSLSCEKYVFYKDRKRKCQKLTV